MQLLKNCVLVLDQQTEDLSTLEAYLEQLSCPMVVVSSADQVIGRMLQTRPYLVILAGNYENWSHAWIEQLRQLGNTSGMMIVALTDCNAPRWLHQEDNPGLDGFLVKPLTGDVLMSLVQSAWARQSFAS
jgi:AmiR/NasT family two-component response regulator